MNWRVFCFGWLVFWVVLGEIWLTALARSLVFLGWLFVEVLASEEDGLAYVELFFGP